MNKKFIDNKKANGFTIVELLIVIVIIGILAAITIVSYTGITARARTARAQNNANSVMNVAHIYNIDPTKNAFPDLASLNSYTAGISRVPAGVTVIAGGLNALTASNAETYVVYQNKGTTGGCIGYYDLTASTVKYIFVGDASTASLNIAAPTCS